MIAERLETIDEVFEFAGQFAPTMGTEFASVFRGHADERYGLEPTLSRVIGRHAKNEQEAVEIESQLVREYRNRSKPLRPQESGGTFSADCLDIYHVQSMQHYGAPTRLLDWTKSFYVALYFAVSNHPNVAGSVHVANVSNMMTRGTIGKPLQKPEDFLRYSNDPPFPILYPPNFDFERGIVQQGLFVMPSRLLCDHDKMYEDALSSTSSPLKKIVIPSNLKQTLLAQLVLMNVTPATLFPGLAGVAKSIHDLALLSVSQR